ncbi:hypothetical protein HDU87_002663 [Geranomyces variabilis]|uniref:Velvet domain-containing protein n=1 Tax=Geranomyces variabilis TaxID=109894 RepID=A0AAD5TUH9_9FUNG|nr:hypothetical protein HDU87_002663 [Geranomyces variabilis]
MPRSRQAPPLADGVPAAAPTAASAPASSTAPAPEDDNDAKQLRPDYYSTKEHNIATTTSRPPATPALAADAAPASATSSSAPELVHDHITDYPITHHPSSSASAPHNGSPPSRRGFAPFVRKSDRDAVHPHIHTVRESLASGCSAQSTSYSYDILAQSASHTQASQEHLRLAALLHDVTSSSYHRGSPGGGRPGFAMEGEELPGVDPHIAQQQQQHHQQQDAQHERHDQHKQRSHPAAAPEAHAAALSNPELARPPDTDAVLDRHIPLQRGELGDIRYELVVLQQPLRARMCGFGGRDRRLVDPPPIVQLIARHLPSNRVIEQSVTDPPLLILHASLYDAAAKEPTMIINTPRGRNSGGYMNALTGCLVSSAYSLQNLEGRHGVYFMFGDLSVRVDGRFSLVFKLCSIASAESSAVPPQHFVSNDITTVITQAHSLPFVVYPAKEFPGMLESTPLTRCFALQGIRLPVRGERRKVNNNLSNARLDHAEEDGDGTPDTLREGPEEGGTLRSLLEQGTGGGGGELVATARPPSPLTFDAANTTIAVPAGAGAGVGKDSAMDVDAV